MFQIFVTDTSNEVVLQVSQPSAAVRSYKDQLIRFEPLHCGCFLVCVVVTVDALFCVSVYFRACIVKIRCSRNFSLLLFDVVAIAVQCNFNWLCVSVMNG